MQAVGRFLPLVTFLPGLPAEIVVRRQHGESRFHVAEFLGKREREPV
jgi:hypothetical protein